MTDLTVVDGGVEEYELNLLADILKGIPNDEFESRVSVLQPLKKDKSRGDHLKLVANNEQSSV